MPNFIQTPGHLFVVATLLPLASFLFLFLMSGLWAMARRYEWEKLQAALGSEAAGKAAVWVAMGAIGLAFVLCLTGAVLYYQDANEAGFLKHYYHGVANQANLDASKAATDADRDKFEKLARNAHHDQEKAEKDWEKKRAERWQGQLYNVAHLNNANGSDPERASSLNIGFKIDSLSAIMFVMVTFIATLIHLFSSGYMLDELPREDVADHQVHTEDGHLHRRGRYSRFFMYLSLFCFSMLNLILADNLFQVFVSWELVGLCSYLLVGFYFERQSASNAANKAFIVNRVGDAGFLIGLMIVWSYLGTFNFDAMFAQVRHPMKDAHEETGQFAGQFVRADWVAGEEGKTARVAGKGEGGAMVVLFPRQPMAEEMTEAQQARLNEWKRGLGTTDERERARLEHRIAAYRGHFHNAGKGSKIKPAADRLPEEHGVMPYWMLVAAGLGIFLGCVGKSAQFPLHVWLPDAMEGPTPVSALIHAATMVAAGVYLVGRCFPLFAPEVLLTIAYTGGITLFVAATIAIVATDIKKVLAYSTVSQLGYMMLALGIGGWVAGLFHLITHAVFKALLFLGSGSVIYGCHHEQEMTKMGGLYPKMRITALSMLMGVLAISGIPLFSGWYSKDAIMAQAAGYAWVHREHALLFVLPLVTAGITTFYMFRMWLMTFAGKPRDPHVHDHAHESPWRMTTPLILLGFLSVVVAWSWTPWEATSSWLGHGLDMAQPSSVMADFGHVPDHHEEWPTEAAKPQRFSERHWAHAFHELAGLLALAMVAIGMVFAFALYYFNVLDPEETRRQFSSVHAFLVNKWYFDHAYSVLIVKPAMIAGHAFKWFDLNILDGAIHALARGSVAVAWGSGKFDNGFVDWLVNLVARVTRSVGGSLRGLQTGSLRNYVLFLALAAVALFVALAYFVSIANAG